MGARFGFCRLIGAVLPAPGAGSVYVDCRVAAPEAADISSSITPAPKTLMG